MKYKIAFFLILALAIFLRFWKLGSFPAGFTWDEAAIGYNAYGILSVHRDEWLSRMPLSFRSFGDYKSPLLVYLVALSELFLGVNELAVRVPVAISGVVLVVGVYFLLRELEQSEETSLFGMVLVAISPWALHFSSIAFESMLAAALSVLGVLFLLKGRRQAKYLIFSGICFALSLYAYHSAKVVVPLSIIVLLFQFRKNFLPYKQKLLIFFATCLLMGAPLAYGSIFGNANARFIGSTIILDANQKIKPLNVLIPLLSSNFLAHFSPSYLFLGAEQTYRQSNMRDGVLSPVEGFLIIVSLIAMFKVKKLRGFAFILVLIVVSVLPATLGADVPHANRALMGLPWMQVLAALGFSSLFSIAREKKMKEVFIGVLVLSMFIGLLWHLNNDRQVYSSSTSLKDLQYGYKQAIAYVRSRESEVNHIVFTNEYGQAYIFILFYKQINPIDFRGGGLANYTITDHPWKDSAGKGDILIVGGPKEFPEYIQSEKDILYPDGKVAFRIIKQ